MPRNRAAQPSVVTPCGDFGPAGLGALMNSTGLPPANEPDAQCWFQIFATLPGEFFGNSDKIVMCRRWQLEPGHVFSLFYMNMSVRTCTACNKMQFSDAAGNCLGGRPRFKSCAGCTVNTYCNEVCQRADWHSHKHACRLAQQARAALG